MTDPIPAAPVKADTINDQLQPTDGSPYVLTGEITYNTAPETVTFKDIVVKMIDNHDGKKGDGVIKVPDKETGKLVMADAYMLDTFDSYDGQITPDGIKQTLLADFEIVSDDQSRRIDHILKTVDKKNQPQEIKDANQLFDAHYDEIAENVYLLMHVTTDDEIPQQFKEDFIEAQDKLNLAIKYEAGAETIGQLRHIRNMEAELALEELEFAHELETQPKVDKQNNTFFGNGKN